MAHQQFERVSPVGAYDVAYISAPVGSDTKIGVAGRGTYLGDILVGEPGTSAVLTLKNGSNVIGVFSLSASMPIIPFSAALDSGLYYQLSGSGTISISIQFLDFAF